MMSKVELKKIRDFDFNKITESFSNCDKPILFVFSCGYEKRSLTQFLYLQDKAKSYDIDYLCFSFATFKQCGSRPENDGILSQYGVNPIELEPKDWDGAWHHLSDYLTNKLDGDAQIYIDYSSMPRNWYCMLAKEMGLGKLGSHASLIYSHGKYFESQYPCVGYGEFHNFSGRPNITSTREVNIFGLSFDSIRTHGIWNFLDPQLSVAVIARSPNNEDHTQRVRKENPEILAASDIVHEVNISEFGNMLATLIDLSRKHQSFGDVALVPDGPKPMVIAMSLVPLYLDDKGFYCWHVSHVKPEGYEPMDIESSGDFFGFGVF
jgi:hypothetical protein